RSPAPTDARRTQTPTGRGPGRRDAAAPPRDPRIAPRLRALRRRPAGLLTGDLTGQSEHDVRALRVRRILGWCDDHGAGAAGQTHPCQHGGNGDHRQSALARARTAARRGTARSHTTTVTPDNLEL